MKILRSISMALGALVVGLGSLVSVTCDKAWALASCSMQYLREGFEPLACGVAKLKRELVQHGLLGSGVEGRISSSLRRESNGYRQHSARSPCMLTTPTLC
ncbi:hypothetical protein [Stutzerimonas nitrititolerans]|uniref:hypothetical protein n=1 Tax=Stutzerimonas nitrititolerans TaxID=2482751 RepID=UPI0028AE2215|nr:hypothetical protein [Stutzerimonas nitrititolerans]